MNSRQPQPSNNANLETVNRELRMLGWDWSNPRIVAYINDLSRIRKRQFNPSNLPGNHYLKIAMFLQVYRRINQTLISFNVNWNAPLITKYFKENAAKDHRGNLTNRLTLNKWNSLEAIVIDWLYPF